MNRQEWIDQARALLQGNEAAADLLAAEIEPDTVEAEFVSKEDPQAEAKAASKAETIAKIAPVTITAPVEKPQQRQGGRRPGFLARFAKVVDTTLDASDKADRPLSGFERLDVKTGEIAEKAIDKGMDALASIPKKMPTLRDRGAAFRGRHLGRRKPT